MRFADNFNPEWGYLAPAPSFMCTARVALVAGAIGATAGAGVVFSLIDRPAAQETSVAGRTLAEGSEPASVAAPATAQLQAPHEIAAAPDHVTYPPSGTLAESEADVASAPGAEAAARLMPGTHEAALAANTTSPQRKVARKQPPQQRLAWRASRDAYDARRESAFGDARAPLGLMPNGSYSMRGQYSGGYRAQDDF